MRFLSAYLRAASAATALLLGVGAVAGVLTDGVGSLANFAFLAPLVALYSFGVILVFGGIGHVLLRSTGHARRTEYLAAAGASGAFVAWFFFRGLQDNPVWFAGIVLLFITTGVVAAHVFWRAYVSQGA